MICAPSRSRCITAVYLTVPTCTTLWPIWRVQSSIDISKWLLVWTVFVYVSSGYGDRAWGSINNNKSGDNNYVV